MGFTPPPRGRGAVSNPSSRFERAVREAFDDGWGVDEPVPPALPTRVTEELARSVISYNDSPDISVDRTVNPYRGCEHGCIYCFARPSHGYLGMSAGLDFETRLIAKSNAAPVLETELRKPRYTPAPLALGANTDPYQPIERQRCVTRGVLETLAAFKHPVAILTKSNLILRDIDLLAQMAADNLVQVMLSVTTLQRPLARVMEPRAATPERRLEAIQALSEAGVPVGVLVAPVVPALTDHELEAILEACRAAGAVSAGYVLLRLPHEIKDLFSEWLATHYPDRAARVLSHIRQSRGGELYDSTFGKRMRGEGPRAELLAQRFALASKRLGFQGRRVALRTDLFTPPPRTGDQLRLF
jgi:DNA repair photolyase